MDTVQSSRTTGREAPASRETGRRLVASNRRARHDYAILKTFEAGIALLGTEVKSLRAGRASLVDAFAQERDGEILLYGLHIPEYGYGTWTNHQPRRTRRLLLHRVEINRIVEKLRDSGTTLVPLSLYFENGWAKVEIGLARGKRSYDKRQAIAERDANREIARELSRRLKGSYRGRGRQDRGRRDGARQDSA
jgi:SsrA-binding protein